MTKTNISNNPKFKFDEDYFKLLNKKMNRRFFIKKSLKKRLCDKKKKNSEFNDNNHKILKFKIENFINNNHNHINNHKSNLKFKENSKENEERKITDFIIDDELDIENQIIGLPNIGNSCYMNSFLQILLHTPNFIKNLKLLKKEKNIENAFINSIINLSNRQKHKSDLYIIKKEIGKIDQSYAKNNQNDSQIFGIYLIDRIFSIFKGGEENYDGIEEEFDILNKENYGEEELKQYEAKKFINFKNKFFPNENYIEKMFQFYEIETKFMIKSNGLPKLYNIQIKPSIYIDLQFQNKIYKIFHLENLLKYKYLQKLNIKNQKLFPNYSIKTTTQELPKANTNSSKLSKFFKCIVDFFIATFCFLKKKNKNQNPALEDRKYIGKMNDYYYNNINKLVSLPKILIISINRAIINREFNSEPLQFDNLLDLKDYMSHNIINKNYPYTKYTLYAINNCQGDSKEFGHCYSYIKIKQKWFKFNDNKVEEKNPSFASNNVVGLFYKRDN